MTGRRALRALPVLLAVAFGCAGGLTGSWGCPDASEGAMASRGLQASCRVMRKPSLLIEQSERAFERGDLETSYDYLALVHTLHPESAESREVFPLAARIFVRIHFRYRAGPERWDTSEPGFMFGWLEQFFVEGEEFPQPQVEALFVGTRYPLFREFLAYAEARPRLSRWTLTAEKDNGIVRSVTAEATPPGSGATGAPRRAARNRGDFHALAPVPSLFTHPSRDRHDFLGSRE